MPLYFDLSDGGAAADPDARAFVIAARPALGENSVATPNALLMTPAGQVVGEIDPYLGPQEFLAKLLEIMRAQPDYARPSLQELALTDPLDRARLALDLQDLGAARQFLEKAEGAGARYLAGHVARLQRDFEGMEAEFARVDLPEYMDDLRIERAQHAWSLHDFAALAALTADFPAESERCTEALYLRGLALFHLGSKDEALAQWQEIVLQHEQDAWVYRADWAYTEVEGGPVTGMISSGGARSSPLGRIGYIGRANPDLARP